MSRAKSNGRYARAAVRHHCSKCNSRIFPFDSFESKTESPIAGKTQQILLYTYNSKNREDRQAWCWNCNKFVEAERITGEDIQKMYIRRRGIIIRDDELLALRKKQEEKAAKAAAKRNKLKIVKAKPRLKIARTAAG